jgi:hypothetical protein
MTIRTHIRTLAAAALLALTVAGAAVGPANAKDVNTPTPGSCPSSHTEIENGKEVTYTEHLKEGTVITRIENGVGRKYECKAGEWVAARQVVSGTIIGHVLGQTGPRPVLHQIPASGPTFGVAAPVSGGVLAQP